jgi:uncharacterized membrane protein
MRRSLEVIGVGALVLMMWSTWEAMAGPHALPDRIATHFDAAGRPNGWGSPAMLLLLPVVAVALYVAMTVVARFPSAFNYPVRVTAENRGRLEQTTLYMIAWLKTELACLFAYLQWFIIQAARTGQGRLNPLLMPAAIFIIFGTIAVCFVAAVRAARPGSS